MFFYGLKSKKTPQRSSVRFASGSLTEKILALNDMAVILTASKNKIIYCTRSVESILNVPVSDVLKGGWQIILDRVLADDQNLLTKKLRPELRRYLRHLSPEDRLSHSFRYTFRVRRHDATMLIALENQIVRISEKKPSWAYMSILKDITPYGPKDRINLTVSKRIPEYGWEAVFEKSYPMRAEGFTTRETEIMHLVAAGLSSVQIAARLFISAETVRFHRKKMMQKTGCKSSAELVSRFLLKEIP